MRQPLPQATAAARRLSATRLVRRPGTWADFFKNAGDYLASSHGFIPPVGWSNSARCWRRFRDKTAPLRPEQRRGPGVRLRSTRARTTNLMFSLWFLDTAIPAQQKPTMLNLLQAHRNGGTHASLPHRPDDPPSQRLNEPRARGANLLTAPQAPGPRLQEPEQSARTRIAQHTRGAGPPSSAVGTPSP